MTKLLSEELRQVAYLARITIDDAKAEEYSQDLSQILDLFKQLNAVDTTGIEPLAHPLDMVQRLRPDVVTEVNQREQFQSIAPCVEDGLYLVPRVVE